MFTHFFTIIFHFFILNYTSFVVLSSFGVKRRLAEAHKLVMTEIGRVPSVLTDLDTIKDVM